MASLVVLRELGEEDLIVFFEHQKDPDACHTAAFTAKDPSDYAAFQASETVRRPRPRGPVARNLFSRGNLLCEEELRVSV